MLKTTAIDLLLESSFNEQFDLIREFIIEDYGEKAYQLYEDMGCDMKPKEFIERYSSDFAFTNAVQEWARESFDDYVGDYIEREYDD